MSASSTLLPSVAAENDYGSLGNPYSFSDPPMVLFNGETITEYSDIYPGSTVELSLIHI